MTGFIVRITTEALSGGTPVIQLWDVDTTDAAAAIALVRKLSGATGDEKVDVVGTISQSELDGLGVGVGEAMPR